MSFENLRWYLTLCRMSNRKNARHLRFMGGKADLETLKRAVTPPPAMVSKRLQTLVKRFGVDGVAVLVDASPATVSRWILRGDEVGAGARKLVWIVYGVMYAPHELATLFDYATYGRFTAAPAGDPSKPPRQRDSKGKFINDPPKQ